MVKSASEEWIASFNRGDALACASRYEDQALMHLQPFSRVSGRSDIEHFWRDMIGKGFRDARYLNPTFELIGDRQIRVNSGWLMNKLFGDQHQALWIVQADGRALLRQDMYVQ